MFHAEIREGTQVIREFNLDERSLWVRYLAPLLGGKEFVREGHDWTPRKVRIKIIDGPQLRTDQISMGRGWSNAQRHGTDVTQAVLARAREFQELQSASRASAPAAPALAPAPAALRPSAASAPSEVLQERLIGRLGAGPVNATQIAALADAAMPDADPSARRAACERVVWELLATGEAQLGPSDR